MNLCTPREPMRIPHTPAAILLEARGSLWLAVGNGPTGDGVKATGGDFASAANSGKETSGFHSWLPSSWTRVWALTRFSPSQRLICSALTGPYGWPSAPIILYIIHC